jgi:hypothetical protein
MAVQVELQPSASSVLPSSQTSFGSSVPLPQKPHSSPGTGQTQPASLLHVALQPSPEAGRQRPPEHSASLVQGAALLLPPEQRPASSHASLPSRTPLPQRSQSTPGMAQVKGCPSSAHAALHPSPLSALASSQVSPPAVSTTPLPHRLQDPPPGGHEKPCSTTRQSARQPSLLRLLPSSQTSPRSRLPSPQCRQAEPTPLHV